MVLCHPVSNNKSIVEIQVKYVQLDHCRLFWMREGRWEPAGNTPRIAQILGHLFIPKIGKECVWHTPEEKEFNKSVMCNTINPVREKCGEIRWTSPDIIPEGQHEFLVEMYMVASNKSMSVKLFTGNQTVGITVKCRSVPNKPSGWGRRNAHC